MKFKLQKDRFQECIRDFLKGAIGVGGGVDKTEYEIKFIDSCNSYECFSTVSFHGVIRFIVYIRFHTS